ncbi:MAG TPA: hydroxymethylbilane synthase [Hyphomicrobiales bacterium]|nr:hydroxymethylbilane synthase [Rhodobiaceae bacterium]HXK54603.1 hydroxymethylbilane synthase [Hyphomicrobiales bacterium]
MQSKIRIGTRGSPLALAQAEETKARLGAAHGFGDDAFEIVIIKTQGDLVLDRPLAEIGGKELFTKEIEQALLDGAIDLAVHSTKDMPTQLPDGLIISCFLPREDVRDAFISLKAGTLKDLAPGAVIGTASLRRAAQLRHLRPDLKVASFRGNVQTRLRKLEAGEADATFLAYAGLRRLGLADRVTSLVAESDMLPAVGQGAICIESRADNDAINTMLAAIHHGDTADCVRAERAFLAALDGSCRTPIAALARLEGGTLRLRGQVLTPDGKEAEDIEAAGPRGEAEEIGSGAGAQVRARLRPGFFGEDG